MPLQSKVRALSKEPQHVDGPLQHVDGPLQPCHELRKHLLAESLHDQPPRRLWRNC